MKLTQDMIENVFRQIETRNYALNIQAIIHSDELVSVISAQLGVTKDTIRQIIQILLEAHKILRIEIISEDSARGTEKIEGYVVSELSLLSKLKNFFDQQLIILYQKQYHANKGAASIIKELFPQLQNLKQSELGQILNKTIILGEYEKMLEKDFANYSHEWQEKKIIELGLDQGFKWYSDIQELNEQNRHLMDALDVDEEEEETPFATSETEGGTSKRAVDSGEYEDFTDKKQKYPLQRILSIYGVEFFVKIHFRKYEFLYIKQIIDDRQISQKSELGRIKTILQTVKRNIFKDEQLKEYREDIYALDKSITHAMFREH